MPAGPRLAIALISAAALAYEVLLMRLFSIIQWHHFAYMIISIALLGYGASGAFLTLFRAQFLQRFGQAFIVNILLFALAALLCYLLAQRLPFNPLELLWDSRQPLWLLLIYLLLSLPFFFAANAIGLALSYRSQQSPRLYALDLFGAGFGSIGIIALLFIATPARTLLLLGSLIMCSAAVAWLELRLIPRRGAMVFLTLALLLAILPEGWFTPVMSPYKGMQQMLQVSGTRVVEERSSPLGMLSVVESTRIPLRHAPGLSLMASEEPPAQLAIFTDGDGMTVLTQKASKPEQLGYLDQMSSALPYHLHQLKRVLILGAGGGSDVQQARYHEVPQIEAVELNPQMVELQHDYAGFTGDLFSSKGIHLHIAEGRGFVTQSRGNYDLIQIAMLDAFNASSAGLYALAETYLYTVEALSEYLQHLTPSGMLAISRWVKLPPRDTLKLFATATAALERLGVENPAKNMVLIRSWQTSTLLVKKTPFTPTEIAAAKAFCRERGFDLVHYPGITPEEANRYNRLREPLFYQGTQALLHGGEGDFIEHYKFNLQPATDDSPYFFHFFTWQSLPEIMALLGKGGMPLLEMGYLVLVGTLVQALLASLLFVLLPLWLARHALPERGKSAQKVRAMGYFLALGLAFMFIEIAFIQRFILFLHHPLYAISVVLAAFLLFAGMGSRYSMFFVQSEKSHRAITLAVAGIILLGILYLLCLTPLFTAMLHLPYEAKIAISLIIIAPLAFCMGIPFPLGLARLGHSNPELVPWVWGVNGCASVVSSIGAMLTAIHFGFGFVIITALLLYLIAALTVPHN